MKKLLAMFFTLGLFTTNIYAQNSNSTYEIVGEINDGNVIIYANTSVATLESEPSTGGADTEVKKYGVADSDGNVLIEPILDFVSLYSAPFSIEFDNNGFSEEIYDAEYYYYAGRDTLWTPANTKKILVNSDYKVWKDYDVFYSNFITENRFIVKGNGKSILIDGDMNIITDEYAHIIELDDGQWHASTDSSQTDPVYNILLDNNGNIITDSNLAENNDSQNETVGQNSDGNVIIYSNTSVATLESEPSTRGADTEVKKYGVADSDGNVLIEPILDFVSLYSAPFTIEFDNNGFSEEIYDAEYYYYAGQDTLWTPANTKKILVNSDYKVWKDYDVFYSNFITENRFIVKGNGKSILIDSDMNIITDEYAHIIELDDGKWHASTDSSQTNPVYSIVLDNNGNIITDFNPLVENNISNWAEKYITKANELNITIQDKTTAFNTSFFTEKITRIEFCRLAVNTLKALNIELPTIEDRNVFTDTQDENVLLCYKVGIISGIGENKFDPYANITREQAGRILVSMAEVLDVDTSKKSDLGRFSDIDSASNWAKDFVLIVSALETPSGESIMAGTSENTFSPLNTYTTEQAVSTLVRMYELKINLN